MTRIGILGKVLVVSRFSIQKKLLSLLDSGSVKIDLYALFMSAVRPNSLWRNCWKMVLKLFIT